jgi:TusA-related sulfurtransferase
MPSADTSGPPPDAAGRLEPAALPRADQVVDAVGLFCPLPIVRTADRVRRMEPGGVLELRADDRVTLVDLPNWCRAGGHTYLGWAPDGAELRLFLRVGAGRAHEARAGGAATRKER